MDYIENNRKFWNRYSKEKGPWSRPVSKELIDKAGRGDIEIFVTAGKLVPRSWFPKNTADLKVLGLGAGGGQQMPLFAAAGAEVTSYDLSEEQLKRDREVCAREGLNIKTIQGDMMELDSLDGDFFDLIVNPVSTCFVADVNKVWRECHRVLKQGGVLISGGNNPVIYAISDESYEKNELLLTRKIPHSDVETLTDSQIKENGAAEFGHGLTDLIGGQLKVGFHLTDFYEDIWGENFNRAIDDILPQFFATRAVKV